MTLTNDNPTLNEAIQNLANAINATDKAINDINFDFDSLDELEEKESKAEERFFNIIFSMMPKSLSKQMQEPKYVAIFKAKTIDKYILS